MHEKEKENCKWMIECNILTTITFPPNIEKKIVKIGLFCPEIKVLYVILPFIVHRMRPK